MANLKSKAVEMTQRIRDKNYARLHTMSRAERLAFYREQARIMNAKAMTLVKGKVRESGRA